MRLLPALLALLLLAAAPAEAQGRSGKSKNAKKDQSERYDDRDRWDDRGDHDDRWDDGDRGPAHIPPGHLPPPGSCRAWYDGRPPGQQPAPERCAVLLRQRHDGAVIVDSEGRVVRGRYRPYPSRDRYPDDRRSPDGRYPDRGSVLGDILGDIVFPRVVSPDAAEVGEADLARLVGAEPVERARLWARGHGYEGPITGRWLTNALVVAVDGTALLRLEDTDGDRRPDHVLYLRGNG